jgi:hypothetical protein
VDHEPASESSRDLVARLRPTGPSPVTCAVVCPHDPHGKSPFRPVALPDAVSDWLRRCQLKAPPRHRAIILHARDNFTSPSGRALLRPR